MKKIFISGITGFVGANLQEYLQKEKYAIVGVSRKENPINNIISYSNLTKERLDNSKVFIHLAGKAHDLKKTINEDAYFKVNTELTKTVFNQFLKSNCEVFIYMSSVKAVADRLEGILDENISPNPITAYGKSKLAAEQFILSQQIPAYKRVYILRPCMIHGPYNKGNLNLLYNFVQKGIPYPLGAFKNKRSFVSIENLSFIIKELIENTTIKSGIYNVADDTPISTRKLVEIIGNTIQKPSKIWNLSKRFIIVIAKIGDVFPFPINSERLQKLTENYVVSNQKVKKAMGKELPLSTINGIQKTIRSFQ